MLFLQAANTQPSAKPQTQAHTAHLMGKGKRLVQSDHEGEMPKKKKKNQEPESRGKEGQIFEILNLIALRPDEQSFSHSECSTLAQQSHSDHGSP